MFELVCIHLELRWPEQNTYGSIAFSMEDIKSRIEDQDISAVMGDI